MKRIFIAIAMLPVASALFAQSEMSAFTSTGRAGAATTFVTDYHAVGINPSNLGWAMEYEKIGAIGFLEISYSAFSEAITKPELRQSIMNFSGDEFSFEEKQFAASAFTDAPLAINVDVMLVGLAVQYEKVGGFAFSMKERFQWYSKFNGTVSEIMFLGYNADYFDIKYDLAGNELPSDTAGIEDLVQKGMASVPQFYSKVLDGSEFSLSWFREYNFSYGRKLFGDEDFSMYAGVGFKYLAGYGMMDVRSKDGEFRAYSALTPLFDIDYGSAGDLNPSADTSNSGFLPEPVGRGFGFDFGFNAVISEKLKIGFAVTDIGSITWDGNVYSAKDDTLFDMESGGFNSYNLFTQAEEIMGEEGVFEWNGKVEQKVKLPTTVRVGMSYEFVEDKLTIGVDAIIPANDVAGNYNKLLFAFGIDLLPVKWLKLSTGFTAGGNYGFNLPVGLNFIVGEGTWEVGVASRDAITFFAKDGPTLSMSMGFLRFRF